MGFADYFYHLAHRIFKRIFPPNSDLYKYCQAIGQAYDDVLEAIFRLREQAYIITASGKALDLHGKDRGMPRFTGEADDQYRLRLLKAFSFYEQLGTKKLMLKVLRDMGYEACEIDDLYLTEPERWAEFIIRITNDVLIDCKRIYYIANKLKPAHTKLANIAKESYWGINFIPETIQLLVPYPLCNTEHTATQSGVPLQLQLPLVTTALDASWEYPPCGTMQTAGQPGKGCFGELVIASEIVPLAWGYPLVGEILPEGDRGCPLAGDMELETSSNVVGWSFEMCGQTMARSDVA